MPLAVDLISTGEEPEEALRIGDGPPRLLATATVSTQSGGTLVGGPTGATILEINASTTGSNTITFMGTTELDREFTIYNVATVASTSVVSAAIINVFPPVGGSFNGLTANTSFQIGINKNATVTRIGPIPNPGGSIASDRWIYMLSN